MLDQILTSFQKFFSRAFWFGSFLPVVIVTGLHTLIFEFSFPGSLPWEAVVQLDISDKTIAVAGLITVFVVIAYLLTPFTQLFRDLLDGRSLPEAVHQMLRNSRFTDWQKLKKARQEANDDYGQIRSLKHDKIKAIHAASQSAAGKRDSGPNSDELKRAIDAVSAANSSADLASLPDKNKLADAINLLIAAYNSCEENFPPEDKAKLNENRDTLVEIIEDAVVEARYLKSRTIANASRMDLLPTRVASARWQTEEYCLDTYGADFSFLWTRVQMLLPKNSDPFVMKLQDAQSQLHFSALLLGLVGTVPLVWLPVLLFVSKAPWIFLAIGLATIPVLLFLYELVVQSEHVFGQMVCAAIDKYRLTVLTDILHQTRPQTLATERAQWSGLREASKTGNRINLFLASDRNKA